MRLIPVRRGQWLGPCIYRVDPDTKKAMAKALYRAQPDKKKEARLFTERNQRTNAICRAVYRADPEKYKAAVKMLTVAAYRVESEI